MSYASTMQFLQTGMANGPGTEDPRYLAGARRATAPSKPRICTCSQLSFVNGIWVCTEHFCTGEGDPEQKDFGYGRPYAPPRGGGRVGARQRADAIRLFGGR